MGPGGGVNPFACLNIRHRHTHSRLELLDELLTHLLAALPSGLTHQFECCSCHIQVEDALVHARVLAVTHQLHLHTAGRDRASRAGQGRAGRRAGPGSMAAHNVSVSWVCLCRAGRQAGVCLQS